MTWMPYLFPPLWWYCLYIYVYITLIFPAFSIILLIYTCIRVLNCYSHFGMSQVSQAYSIWNYYKIHKNDCIIAINDVPTKLHTHMCTSKSNSEWSTNCTTLYSILQHQCIYTVLIIRYTVLIIRYIQSSLEK